MSLILLIETIISILVKGDLQINNLVQKILQIPVRNIYQEMLQSEENEGLNEARDKDVNGIVSDTVLIYLIPMQVRLLT